MADDNDFPPNWITLENEFLHVLREMHSLWANGLHAVHMCQRMKTSPSPECIAQLDAALKEARRLEALNAKYIETLERMNDFARSKQIT
jgi:hypothetical protein